MISQRGASLLARGGAAALAAGVAARFLLVGDLDPLVEASAIGLLLLGAGMLLVARAAEGGLAPAPGWMFLLPLVAVWAARALDPLGIKRAIDAWAACAGGFALRDFVTRRGMGGHLRATLATAAVALAAFGIAQTLYLRREVAALAHELVCDITISEMGRAFLASWRAAATFVSPNAFAGFLLLAAAPVLGAVVARPTAGGIVLGGVLLAGFACAGSAGAAMAAAFGLGIAGVAGSRGLARAAWTCGLLAAAAIAAAVFATAATETEATGKIRTLQERMDYQAQGLRILRDDGLLGVGLERTAAHVTRVRAPGEATSRSLHDWWLQGLVEAGVAFVPVALVLAWMLVRVARVAMREPASPEGGEVIAASSRPWTRGLIAGAAAALIAQPFATVLPYGNVHPLVHGVVFVTVLALAWLGARGLDLASAGAAFGARAGLVAFGLHGFVDFDLYVPGVMIAFALALAVALPRPIRGPASQGDRTAIGIFGFVTLLMPVFVLLFAQTRDAGH